MLELLDLPRGTLISHCVTTNPRGHDPTNPCFSALAIKPVETQGFKTRRDFSHTPFGASTSVTVHHSGPDCKKMTDNSCVRSCQGALAASSGSGFWVCCGGSVNVPQIGYIAWTPDKKLDVFLLRWQYCCTLCPSLFVWFWACLILATHCHCNGRPN